MKKIIRLLILLNISFLISTAVAENVQKLDSNQRKHILIKYLAGNTNEKSFYKAFQLLLSGIDNNDPVALNAMGLLCISGTGDYRSVEEGLRYLERAKDLGYMNAYENLAFIYRTGIPGVKKDIDKAYDYLMEASKMGSLSAKYALGQIFLDGELGERDFKKAQEFFESSIELPESKYSLAKLLLNSNDLNESVKDRALKLLYDSAVQGNANAQFEIGMMYLDGKNYQKNEGLGVDFLKQSSRAGNKYATEELMSYFSKHQDKASIQDIEDLLSRMKDYDPIKAEVTSGEIYYRQLFNISNKKKEGFEKLLSTAKSGNPVAQRNLGIMYYNGDPDIDIEKDEERAFDMFLHSAIQGDPQSQYLLGAMYYKGAMNNKTGWYLPMNLEQGHFWIKKSADNGYPKAKAALKLRRKK